MEKLISLHLAYGGGHSLNNLADIIHKLHVDIERDPGDPEAYVNLARACAVYRPAVERHAWGTHIHVQDLSKISETVKRSDTFTIGQVSAVDFYQIALERDPMRIDAYKGIARCYMFFDEFERAVMEFKKLAIVNPVGKWKYYFAIGDTFASQGQMPEARAFWDRVAERAFTDATLYFRLGTRYYWAGQSDTAVSMLRKAISIYSGDYRYHLVLGNVLSDLRRYAEAISEYREALRLSVHTMLLPVRRTMYRTQVKYAHELYVAEEYDKALAVYQEIKKFQEVLNKYIGGVVPEYADILVQIARCEAGIAGQAGSADSYRQIADRFPEATCWVSDHLVMSIGYYASLQEQGQFSPHMSVQTAEAAAPFPKIREGFSTRIFPWVRHAVLSKQRIHLGTRYTEVELDPASGRKLSETSRSGYLRYFGDRALRISGEKLSLSEIQTGESLWEVDGSWSYNCKANTEVLVGLSRHKLQALDIGTGKLLWEVPSCEEFTVTERYVTLKRVKRWVARTGGLEEHAHGDTDAIGYIFQVVNALTGEVVLEKQTSGSHYWRVPVVAGDLVLLTDGFAHRVDAHEIASGKLCWKTQFDSFFAAPPLLVNGKVHLYMRRPKLKTIIQYILEPTTGDIEHQTDLKVNSLYRDPIVIGDTSFFFDPVRYELIGVDAKKGGVTGRHSVLEVLPTGSHKHVITVHGQDNHIFIYTQDGLVVRLDVGG